MVRQKDKSWNAVVVLDVKLNSFQMPDLEKKLKLEAQNDSTIIACRFPFPSLQPVLIKEEGIDSIWVYKITS